MFWADTIGLAQVCNTMRRFYDAHGEWRRPAPLLERLAREGKGFKDF
jgi:3-hydroxyacyl-CoA dehydrogenase